ncbi:MAG: hypothetical protein R3D55_11930 [Chloroflexota bacterium]
MATSKSANKVKASVDTSHIKPIQPGTPEMESLLRAGYPDMTVKKAETIIKERKANPQSWPYEQLERAEAFLAAYNTGATVVAQNPGWEREDV